MVNSSKKIVVMVSSLAAIGTLGLALYLAGFNISGMFTATAGEKGLQNETWNINIADDNPVSYSVYYHNRDGQKFVNITLTDGLSSSDESCIYQKDLDVQFFVNSTINDYLPDGYCHLTETSPCQLNMRSGDNNVTVMVVPNHNRCSLSGTYSIGFTV